MKLKEFLKMVSTTEILVCIPYKIVAENKPPQDLFYEWGGYDEIDSCTELDCEFVQWSTHIVGILSIAAHMYDIEALRLYNNQEALDIVLDLEIETIKTHLAEYERAMIAVILK